MTAVAVPVSRRPEVLQWLAPSPLWNQLPDEPTGPWIAELGTDTFVDDFTAMLADGADRLATTEPARRDGTGDDAPYRLFHPLNQRYYLVSATLVCRRPGIPDHTVHTNRKERTTFVIRRLGSAGEQAFVEETETWVAATAARLVPGELQHPMHPAPVAPFADPGTPAAALGLGRATGGGRTLHFGYIPVALRDKLVRPMADPAKALADMRAAPPPGISVPDPVLSWLFARVIEPWRQLVQPAPLPPKVGYASLYLILDLGDWFEQYLPEVHAAILAGTNPAEPTYQALLAVLAGITAAPGVSLRQAIADTKPYRALLTGADIPGPATPYDLRNTGIPASWLGNPPAAGSLANLAQSALAVHPPEVTLPPELEGMIRERPVPGADGTEPTYVIRTVFEHAPCRPVLSAPTHPFELAGPLDPDAPARKILLQMPDITNLRAAQRGVAIEMPPSLKRTLDRVTPDLLKGGPLGPDLGVQLGWICSFSLQIIFLVAFIVMFIFLILLNIVFWWLPFLKICFPIPIPPSTPKGPTP